MNTCLLPGFLIFFARHIQHLHVFLGTIWILNGFSLILFVIELVARQVNWCNISHAYLMVLLSITSSIISSSFFLSSLYDLPHVCSFAPIVAILCRTIAKHFTWALYIVRGQMVMVSLDNKYIQFFGSKAPYILLTQCIIITACFVLFVHSQDADVSSTPCAVHIPLWLLISSAFIGEICYGLGFMYIFYKVMTQSLENIYDTLPKADIDKAKEQLRYHITIYLIQFTCSMLFLSFVSLCVCFETLVFFEAELFVSNLCCLCLFRDKVKIFKKAIRRCLYPKEDIIKHHAQPLDISQKHTKSSRNLRALQTRQANQFTFRKNTFTSYFLSNKWVLDTEIINATKDIMRGTPTPQNARKCSFEIFDVIKRTESREGKQSKLSNHESMPTMEALEVITDTLNLQLQKTQTSQSSKQQHQQTNSPNSPGFLLHLESLRTNSEPIYHQNTEFHVDDIVFSLSSNAMHEITTPRVPRNTFISSCGQSTETTEESQSTQLLDYIDIGSNVPKARGRHRAGTSVSLKHRFTLKKLSLAQGPISYSTAGATRGRRSRTSSTPKPMLVDRETLMKEDFGAIEPITAINTMIIMKPNEMLFTPTIDEEDDIVYLDNSFDFGDSGNPSEFQAKNGININVESIHGIDISQTFDSRSMPSIDIDTKL